MLSRVARNEAPRSGIGRAREMGGGDSLADYVAGWPGREDTVGLVSRILRPA